MLYLVLVHCWIWSALTFSVLVSATNNVDADIIVDEEECFHHETDDIRQWVINNGGYIHENLDIRSGQYGRGFFAKGHIPEGVDIARVPLDLVINQEVHPCDVVKKLRDEMRRGECSKYWPYIKFMEQVAIDIPNSFDSDLVDIVSDLPPNNWVVHTNRMMGDCQDHGLGVEMSDAVTLRALFLYVTRSGPEGMQPIFDIFNHGYGSTKHYTKANSDHFKFVTDRAHVAGEELFNQFRPGVGAGMEIVQTMIKYNVDPDGAPEIFRDYGFIEQFPTMWWFIGSDAEKYKFIVEDESGSVSWLPETSEDYIRALWREANTILLLVTKRTEHMFKGPISCEKGQCTTMGSIYDGENMTGTRARHIGIASSYRQAYQEALQAAINAANSDGSLTLEENPFRHNPLLVENNGRIAHIGTEQINDSEIKEVYDRVEKLYDESIIYLKEKILGNAAPHDGTIYMKCQNENEMCLFWASHGECENNPTYMKKACMLVCKACLLTSSF